MDATVLLVMDVQRGGVERVAGDPGSMPRRAPPDTMERPRAAPPRARPAAASDAGAEVTSTYELEVGIRAGTAEAGNELLLGGRGLA